MIIVSKEKGKPDRFFERFVYEAVVSRDAEAQKEPLFTTYREIAAKEGDPEYIWHGGKISLALWKQITAFFEHTQRSHSCESQVRLYYNRLTGEWAAWAYPQRLGTGMFTKEIDEATGELAERRDRQRAQFSTRDGWEEFGTVHHHCTASAFQSGTDSNDEKDRVGLHITVGHITQNTYDLHWRVTFKQGKNVLFYNAAGLDLSDWFEPPADLALVPPKYRAKIDVQAAIVDLLKQPDPTVPFPEEWRNNLIAPVVVQRTHYQGGGQHWNSEGFMGYGGRDDPNTVVRYVMDNCQMFNVDPEGFAAMYLAINSLPGVYAMDINNGCRKVLRGDIEEAMKDASLASLKANGMPFPKSKLINPHGETGIVEVDLVDAKKRRKHS